MRFTSYLYLQFFLNFSPLHQTLLPYYPQRRHQEVTSQLSSEPANENAAYQWTGSLDLTQGQTQHGYNYHHIDQRTENQSTQPACVDTKSNSQQSTTDVYAEFTTDAAAVQCRSEQFKSYYEPGVKADYISDDPRSRFQNIADSHYRDDPNPMCTSELPCTQYHSDGQSQYKSNHAHYQFDREPFYQSDVHLHRGDHAQYVAEEYVNFLTERWALNSTSKKVWQVQLFIKT